ncbi:hypothetical protein B0H12DRAFT_1158216 [Mycena haematopus]|nr:hypothetical protein B0H12DRAFT_1158216 [Mycena haematopus]
MFEPFQNVSEFHPGLILWCDPKSYDMEMTTLPPNTFYDRKSKMRELRPCLVVDVDQQLKTLQVARLCATVVRIHPSGSLRLFVNFREVPAHRYTPMGPHRQSSAAYLEAAGMDLGWHTGHSEHGAERLQINAST